MSSMKISWSSALVAALALGCQGRESPGSAPGAAASGGVASAAALGAPAASPSLPVLATVPDFLLVDTDREPFGLPDLRGKAFVADFFYSRCTAICERLTSQVAALQGELAREPLFADVKLISVSVDPAHDTPEVLKAYAARFKAEPSRWHFLTGGRDAVWKLSRDGFKLGVGDAPPGDAAGPIFHSDRLALVDRDGRLRGLYDAFAPETRAALRRDLAAVLQESPAEQLAVPPEADHPAWLAARRDAQVASAAALGVFHDFKFVDRVAESGITFRHVIVDDSGRDDKAVHYDHGTAVAVADVDGDGRPDLFFANQAGRSELWRNLGEGRFEDATATSGLAVPERVAVGASFADVDNDGDADLFVTSVRAGNLLYLNEGNGRFRDATAASGLAAPGKHASGAVFFDYDRDGLLDVFVANIGVYTTTVQGRGGHFIGLADAFAGHLKPERAEGGRLYHNEGGAVFRDVTESAGLGATGWTGDASAFDQNADGYPDLYVLNMQGADQFLRNRAGRGFEDTGRRVFPRSPWGAMGIKVFDFDGDARLDVFLTDMHTDMSPPGLTPERAQEKIPATQMYPPDFLATDTPLVYGNAAWRDAGGGKYEEVSDAIGFETYWPWGLSAGDLNADGDPDVFVTGGMGYPFRYGLNAVLLNDGGRRFAPAEFVLGVEPRRDGRTTVPFFELACGPDAADREHRLCAQGVPGRRQIWAARSSRSSAMVDLDGDGDLDLVTMEFNDRPQVLMSDLTARRPVNAVSITLVGARSNRMGLGARVTVTAGGRRRVQLHDGKSGYLAQSALPLYFGLGAEPKIARVDVLWPSGKQQSLIEPSPTAGRLEIREE